MAFNGNGTLLIDDNAKPVQWNSGLLRSDSQTLSANNTTANVPIFSITGTVIVNALYGVVTTALGNCTAAYFRLNDGTAQSNITLNTGTTLTASAVGSSIVKKDLATAAVALISSSQERVSEPTVAEGNYFSPFVAQQKTGAVATNIEFVYTTTDTPTSGAITFFVSWYPLSAGSSITAL